MALSPASSHGGGLPSQWDTTSGTLEMDVAVRKAIYLYVNALASSGAQSDDLILASGSDGTVFEVTSGGNLILSTVGVNGGFAFRDTVGNPRFSVEAVGGLVATRGGVTSGALPTTTFVSATGKRVDVNVDRYLVIPFTGDATNNAATLLIELSPDNVTYSALDTLSIAAALNLTGAINVPVSIYVPAAWYVKLTSSHGTIGTCTYF